MTAPIQSAQEPPRESMSREPQSPPGPLPRRVRVYLALILALVFLIFSPGLRAGFINWDDDLSLTANPAVLEFNWDNWTDIFLPTQNPSYYQPLTFFSFAIEKQLFGLNPFIFHLNNLLLHLTCVGLVFCLTYYWGRGNWPAALLTALLFGIHPLRVESVVWITERKDVLSTLFSLAGLWTYSSALLKTNRRNYYIQLTIVWFVAACLAKPQAIIFPFLLCLIDFYFHRKFTLKTMIEKIPFLFLAAGFLAFNLRLLEPILNQKFYDSYTLVEKFCLASYGLLSMFIRTWIPTKLSLVYPFPEKTSSGDWPWMVTWAPVLVALVLYLGSRLCRHSRLYWFSLSFFILTLLLPLANMSYGFFINDRYAYLPHVGLFFGLVTWAIHFIKRLNNEFTLLILSADAVAIIIFLVITTYFRADLWQDNLRLWSDVINKYPTVALAYSKKAIFLSESGQHDEALQNFNQAIALDPVEPQFYNNRGYALLKAKRASEALSDLTKAIALNPGMETAYFNRAKAYADLNQPQSALVDLKRVTTLNPANATAFFYSSLIYSYLRQFDLAYQEALLAQARGFKIHKSYWDQLRSQLKQ